MIFVEKSYFYQKSALFTFPQSICQHDVILFIAYNIIYSVCSQPTHIEARSKVDRFSWLGTQTTLLFDDTPKPEPNRNWSYGISRNFGLICYQKLQPEGIDCPDFEVRFCCDESYKQQNSSISSLR